MNPDLPQSGDVIAGKYAIEHVVGEGGMCVVYAAKHLQLHQRVALKVLRPDVAHQPEAVERFMREGRAAIRIRSEYCVRILDVDVLPGGEPYIVMEHLDGSDLEALILANGASPVTPAVDYILQASEAIAEAHTLGIVHRDLKPANLFFSRRADGTPWIKVLDFGISKVTSRLTARREIRLTGSDTVMGSPQYMSPEQLKNTRDVDVRADIWSLGAILHELLSGTPPFTGDTVTAVCASILQDPAPALSKLCEGVPAGLDAAVRRCLEKDPARRFSSMAEVAEALAEFASPAGRASVQRIVGIVALQSATEGPGGIMTLANEKTAWGSTDPSWKTDMQKRRTTLSRIAMGAAMLVVLAVGATGAVTYAETQGVEMPGSVTAAAARVRSLVSTDTNAPKPTTDAPLEAHKSLEPPAPVPAPVPAPAPPPPAPAVTVAALPSPPVVPTASAIAARVARAPTPVPAYVAPAPQPAHAPLPSPAAYLPAPPPLAAPVADEPRPVLQPAPAPATPATTAPVSPDVLFDDRK